MNGTKMTLVQKRPYNKNGYTGIGYAGYTEGGQILKFTSPNPGAIDHEIYAGEIGFNPNRCEVIFLEVNLFDPANPKYKEITTPQEEKKK